jgi:hypothetical protein
LARKTGNKEKRAAAFKLGVTFADPPRSYKSGRVELKSHQLIYLL